MIGAFSDRFQQSRMRHEKARWWDRVDVGCEELKIFKSYFPSIHSTSRWPHELLVKSCQLGSLAFRSPISIEFWLYRCNQLRISIGTSSDGGENRQQPLSILYSSWIYRPRWDYWYYGTRKRYGEEPRERLQDRHHRSYWNHVDSGWCSETWSTKQVDSWRHRWSAVQWVPRCLDRTQRCARSDLRDAFVGCWCCRARVRNYFVRLFSFHAG